MRWPFGPYDNAAGAVSLAHGFTLKQHRDMVGQSIYLARLRGNDLVQLIAQAFQMRQSLFDFRAHLAPQLVAG